MLRKIFMTCLCVGGLLIAAPSQALDKKPRWRVVDEALTYLNAVPGIAWVKVEDQGILIGWQGLPKNFARLNKTAARRAAQALHNEVTVYSVPAEHTTLTLGDDESYLCKTTANPTEIVDSNCR